MSSSNCSVVEGSSNPSQDAEGAITMAQDEKMTEEQGGKKRKRSRRGRSTDDRAPSADKPRRERANFNAAQLHALEQLFHDQKYPDGELRAKIAQRLDLNEERVQIWFQNRRAKYKRLQREGGHAVQDELSPLANYECGQPSTMDYIPPQLDADMLGPGPSAMQNFPQPRVAIVNSHVDNTDPNPVQEASAPVVCTNSHSIIGNQEGASKGLAPFANGLSPFANGVPMLQAQQQQVNHDHRSRKTAEWINWKDPSPEVRSPQSLDEMHHRATEQLSVGKFPVKPESVEYPAAISQTRMNVVPAAGVCSAGIPGPSVTMCPTIEPWCGNSLEAGGAVSQVPSLSCGTPVGSTSKQRLPNPVTSEVAPSACSRTKPHSGEAPCHKDSKCITCREKPPPNQVCTALPAGERNELDEALYRCAVGSILGIRSLTPQVNGQANGSTPQPHQTRPSSTQATDLLENSPLTTSTGPKSTKASRENPLSGQRRMAMERKERQLEAEYLSSSSDSSSDSEEEIQRKRRRKVVRKSDSGAPPNRVCTAVPLLDRTLPLPCLTKDLDLQSYFHDDKAAGQQLLSPGSEYPSCLPSPLSLDRLSSPEPRSSPSEHPEYSSSSSSDLSDFEYIPAPVSSNSRDLPATARTAMLTPEVVPSRRNTTSAVHHPGIFLQRQCSVREQTAPLTDVPFQHGGAHPPCMARPDPDCTVAPTERYTDGMPAHPCKPTPPTGPQGVLSSVPPPFILQLDPATLSSSDNSDKRTKTEDPLVLSSASEENRRNHTCEILAESRRVGEICSSPASPWSNCSLRSPYFNPVSPPIQPPYPQFGKQPNDARTFDCAPALIPVHSMYSGNPVDRYAPTNHNGFTQPPQAYNTDTNKHIQLPSLHHNHPAYMQQHTNYYPPITQGVEQQVAQEQPMGNHQVLHHANTVEKAASTDFLPMRSLERAPPTNSMPTGASYSETHRQNGYSHGISDARCHGFNPQVSNHCTIAPPPPNRLCTSVADVAHQWTMNVNLHEQFAPFASRPACNY
ncbi:flocculation protein FLO11-like [Patiria miniata]|uniref:Homeobox domain-containing protein n=1 Tax=Patiria miniata TaxID=46514 RepID=A0A913Z9U7_PATMI|nr:flocculation protein FLO11-like [Patiria miniata]